MGLELAQAFVKVYVDNMGLPRGFKEAERISVDAMQSIHRAMTGLLAPIAAYGTNLLYKALFGAGDFEQTTIAFETMIGSAEQTKKTLEDLNEFAAKTPFEMPEILAASRGLIQFGERGDELMETLNLLGNSSAGASVSFGELAGIFNQVRGVGKLLTQDFRQLSTRGILSLTDIAKHYGVTTEAAQKMLSEGKISFDDMKAMFRELSSEGGRFANLMLKQSTSFKGLWSTLNDAIGITARTIGSGLLPESTSLLEHTISLVDMFRKWTEENSTLAGYLLATTTGVAALTTSFTALSVAANLAGISMKGALIGTGIGAALIAIGAAAGYIAAELKTAAVESLALSDAAQDLLAEFSKQAGEEDKNIALLKSMRFEHGLLNSQMAAAESAINALKEKYGDFGMTVDWATGEIIGATDALEKLEALQAKEKKNLLKKALQENIDAQQTLAAEIQKTIDGMSALNAISESFKLSGLQGEFDSLKAKSADLLKQLKELGSLEVAPSITTPGMPKAPGAIEGIPPGTPVPVQEVLDPGMPEAPESVEELPDFKAIQWAEDAIAGIEKAMAKIKVGEEFKRSLLDPIDLANEKVTGIMSMLEDPMYGISGKDAEKALRQIQAQFEVKAAAREPLVGAGRIGFAEFGQQIQDALLQNDPAKATLNENEKQSGLLDRINRGIEALNKKPAPSMGLT